jgi:flagellar assembly factor FliW
MNISTSRFGRITCDPKNLLRCPDGLIGFEQMHLWAVLTEGNLAWLQSIEQPEVALPTVSPYSFVPGYEPLFSSVDLDQVSGTCADQLLLLAVVNQHGREWTLNLRAPLILHWEQRLAWQLITRNEQPLRHVLSRTPGTRRKTA